jgi:hypothetical protein
MSKAEIKEPVYDERVNRILDYLEQGVTRDEVAGKFRYTSHRSMDIFMSRKNFKWDKRVGTYVPVLSPNGTEEGRKTYPSDKVRSILAELSKEGADLKEVARKVGFESHMELAAYMKSKGYEWSEEISSYKQIGQAIQCEGQEEKANQGKVLSLQDYQLKKAEHSSLERFIPMLELLEEHFEQLHGLLTQNEEVGQLPRFTLPGRFVTKSVHMTDMLDQMVRDFSKEKNVNQREIFEVALIEFFQKYGYEREVKTLLKIH